MCRSVWTQIISDLVEKCLCADVLACKCATHAQSGALPVVACEVQDALGGHGQAGVLRQARHPVLVLVQVLLHKRQHCSLVIS